MRNKKASPSLWYIFHNKLDSEYIPSLNGRVSLRRGSAIPGGIKVDILVRC